MTTWTLLSLLTDYSQLQSAAESNARLAVFLGERELQGGFVTIKQLSSGKQEEHKLGGSAFDVAHAASVIADAL
jgi:histidyl-tRNA synthetase